MSKIWKLVLLIILIIACLVNVTIKLASKISFDLELSSSIEYVKTIQNGMN